MLICGFCKFPIALHLPSATVRPCSRRPLNYISSKTAYRTLHQHRVIVFSSAEQESNLSAREGQMSNELMESMKNKIHDALNAETVEVVDVEGDGQHVTINVISSAFEGKSSVDRQRMVYKAIWYELQNTVHAVDAMKTQTPAEASQ